MNNNKILYTVISQYKDKSHIHQVFADNIINAELEWIKNINLNKIGIPNDETIKDNWLNHTMNEDFHPCLLNGLQSVWCFSVSTFSGYEGDYEEHDDTDYYDVIANVFSTIISKKISNNHRLNILHDFSKDKILYSIQLDFKGGNYVYQIFANNPMDAKIKWLKEFDFNVVYGTPKNIEIIKNNILSNKNDPDFIPQELKEFDSVWSTTVQLGDEVGRVTIVATQTDFLHSDRL